MTVSNYLHLIYACKQTGTVTHVGSIEGSTDDGSEESVSSTRTQNDTVGEKVVVNVVCKSVGALMVGDGVFLSFFADLSCRPWC